MNIVSALVRILTFCDRQSARAALRRYARCIMPALTLCVLAGCPTQPSRETIQSGHQAAISHNNERAQVARLDDNVFRVSLTRFDGQIEKQPNEQWCWAACAATALRSTNVYRINPANKKARDPLTCDDIIREFAQFKSNQAADADLAIRALAPELNEQFELALRRAEEKRERGSGRDYSWYWFVPAPQIPKLAALVQGLAAGDPVVIGVVPEGGGTGHAVLAYEAEYQHAATRDNTPSFYLRQVRALDPLDGSTVTYSAEDLERLGFASGRQTAIEYTRARIEGLKNASWQRNPYMK